MRKKIVVSLLSLFVLFSIGGTVASWYVSAATKRFQTLVELHEVEGLRRNLVISVQAVQADLYTARTPLGRRLDAIVANVKKMDAAAEECSSCHHSPRIEEQIDEVLGLIDDYKTVLSRYITTSANRSRIEGLEREAAGIGDEILRESTAMSEAASLALTEVAGDVTSRINDVSIVLIVTPILATALGVGAFLYLVRSVTGPVQRLAGATRIIASGDLGHRVQDEWGGEFGELATHFNSMSVALQKSYEKLQRSNEDLLREISERRQSEQKREELQDLLVEAQKMEALGRLSAGVAHEFNNFLQVIQGCAERLARKRSAEGVGEAELEMISDATGRGADLTRQLLAFGSRAEGDPHSIDLNDTVRTARAMIERIFPEAIELQVRLSEALRPVMADPAQIEQVLLNLALNARDAMPGGGLLSVETDFVEDSGDAAGWVVLRVSDTGHGMDDEMIRNIFDPFFTTKGVGMGAGLGLATVYGIVRSHGGQIECRSQVDRGTVFEIRLPALPGISVPTRAEGAPPKEIPRGRGSILFVDDESAVVRVMSESLEEYGYLVRTADSGEKALELFREHRDEVDVVVLDLGMPGMGGRACLRKLLEIEPHAKIIISTAYTSREDETEMMQSGACGFLAKPYRISEMLSKIQSVLNPEA